MLGKFGRFIRKLQRLRLVDGQLAELQTQVRDLQQHLTEVHNEVLRLVDGQLAELQTQVRDLQQHLTEVHNEALHLRDQDDLIKSKLEIPRALIDEFQKWKEDHPAPSEPLVSVCVATYNRARLLTDRCIPSVLGQTYGRLELIVVGDGCTDGTEALVARIPDPRLRFLNLPARGIYPTNRDRRWMVAGTQAGNHAMSLAEGEFITHLDDDDEYLPDRLEKLVDFAVSRRYDFIWHPFWWEPEPGRWALNEANDLALGQVTTSSVFYRGWLKRLGWDPDAHLLGEPGDWNLFRRIKFLGAACGRYPEPLLRHHAERKQDV